METAQKLTDFLNSSEFREDRQELIERLARGVVRRNGTLRELDLITAASHIIAEYEDVNDEDLDADTIPTGFPETVRDILKPLVAEAAGVEIE